MRLLGLRPGRSPALVQETRPHLLLASEGRPFGPATLRRAAELALADGAEEVRILTIARIWGTSLGFPNPWLMPSRHEWQAQRDNVEAAIGALSLRGMVVSGEVVGTRNAARRIAREAERPGCSSIVMGADPRRSRLVGNLLWPHEPYRVRQRARVPVHLVIETARQPAQPLASVRDPHRGRRASQER